MASARGKTRLSDYRRRREAERTPEPFGGEPGEGRSFVIQEHHARRLHWDFRLERDGVLVSWAVPKGLPESPDTNRLAVHVEDHPLDYGGFEGEIPAGQYGAGTVSIFDSGTYDLEKWTDREVKVVLHGRRVPGRYVLFKTRGDNWIVHRMDPPLTADWSAPPERLRPMLPTRGRLPRGGGWGYDFAWNGRRALVRVTGGQARVRSARGEDVTARYPELRPLGRHFGATQVLLDGEVVALDPDDGRPRPSRLRRRSGASADSSLVRAVPLTYLAYDLLHLDGRSLLDEPYERRRRELDGLELTGESWQVPPWWTGSGRDVLRASVEQGLPGVVAKRLNSAYEPGERSKNWIEVSNS